MNSSQSIVNKGIDWTCGYAGTGESTLRYFWSGKGWGYTRIIALIMAWLAILLPMFVVYGGIFPTMNSRAQRMLVIAILLFYAFLKYPLGKRKWRDAPNWLTALDFLCIFLTLAVTSYTLYSEIIYRMSQATVTILGTIIATDSIFGWILVFLLLEATRRTFGWVLVLVPGFFLAYSLTADLWPGPLMGAKASFAYLVSMLYSEQVGIFGEGVEVLLSMVFIFLLFGSFMVSTRVGALFTSLANGLAGKYTGGPAKAAVVASYFFGMASGSAVANVATCGCFTIPLMKNIGYRPVFAAAVETVASTGSYFCPPIMGTAAFIIAAFTNTPYIKVALYATLPAFLYYLALFIQIHVQAKKTGLSGLPKDQVPSAWIVLKEGWYLLLPIIFLVTALAMGYSITLVAALGTAGVLVVSFFSKNTRQTPREVMYMLESSATDTIGISLAMVIVGIIAGTTIVSGLGNRLALMVELLSQGRLLQGLFISAIVLLVLGTALNPLLVYYMGYIFIMPAMVNLGAPIMPFHIFMLIYAGLANITPPVAMPAFTAAAIAQCDAQKTGWQACRLGFAAYIVPFMLVLQPSLLLMGGSSIFFAIFAIAISTLGICGLAIALEGWLFRNTTPLERVIVFVGGALQVTPFWQLNLIGLIVLLGTSYYMWYTARNRRPLLAQEVSL